MRGECNSDGRVDIADHITLLTLLFQDHEKQPRCLEACDTNADGTLDLSDAIHILGFLFLGTARPEAPFPECGAANAVLGCDAPRCP